MSGLNFVDFIILAIFILSAMAGLARGFISEVISLATWIIAFFVAAKFASPLAHVFTNSASVQGVMSQASSATGMNAAQPISYVALGLSFFLLFVGTLIAGAIVSYFLNIAFQVGILGVGNRLLGAIFGLVRGFIINVVFIFLVQLSPFGSESWWQQSQFVGAFQPAVQWLASIVSPELAALKDKMGQTLEGVGSSLQNTISGYTH